MEAMAKARFVRSTPQKSRRVVNEIRGKRALEAYELLRFAPQAVAKDVAKVLRSAMYNVKTQAEGQGESVAFENMTVKAAYVDEGPTMKRFRPRAQGRAGRILKRTSHITVIVASEQKENTK